jgi:hypothetical protein
MRAQLALRLLGRLEVRRIVRTGGISPYLVHVRRRGVSALDAQLLVRAPSRRAAAQLAACIAERNRGGMFEATAVRRAARDASAYPALAYDDADLRA